MPIKLRSCASFAPLSTSIVSVKLMKIYFGCENYVFVVPELSADLPCVCPKHLFRCSATRRGECTCIPRKWVCDNDVDCDEGDDEQHCGEWRHLAAANSPALNFIRQIRGADVPNQCYAANQDFARQHF